MPALASFHAVAFALERLNRRLAVVDDANLERERTTSRRTAESAARQRLFNIYDLPTDREARVEDTALADALHIIGRHHGIDFRIPARSGPPYSPVGLVDILDASGIRARRVRFTDEGNWWHGDSNALLVFRAEDGRAPWRCCRECSGATGSVDPVSKRQRPDYGGARRRAGQNEAWMFYRPLPSGNVKPADLLGIALHGSAADLARLVSRRASGRHDQAAAGTRARGSLRTHVMAGGSAGALYVVAAGDWRGSACSARCCTCFKARR